MIHLSFLSLKHPPTHTHIHTLSVSLVHPYHPRLHAVPPPQNTQSRNDVFDTVANLKLALGTSCCEKKKMFPGVAPQPPLPPSIPIQFFYFFLLLLLFLCPCFFVGIKAILVLLKMTVMSSVSNFHVISDWNPPSSKKKKKK